MRGDLLIYLPLQIDSLINQPHLWTPKVQLIHETSRSIVYKMCKMCFLFIRDIYDVVHLADLCTVYVTMLV